MSTDLIPNQMHKFVLLYMLSDTLHGNKYKYILSRINAASRYKVARPLRTKQAADVATMIANIYKVGPLTYPNDISVQQWQRVQRRDD